MRMIFYLLNKYVLVKGQSELENNYFYRRGFTPGGPVKYDIVHMRDQAFLKQPLNEFGSLPKHDP